MQKDEYSLFSCLAAKFQLMTSLGRGFHEPCGEEVRVRFVAFVAANEKFWKHGRLTARQEMCMWISNERGIQIAIVGASM